MQNNPTPMKRICNWKDETVAGAAIASGVLWPFLTCSQCGNYDFVAMRCRHVGKTTNGASCDFWEDVDA